MNNNLKPEKERTRKNIANEPIKSMVTTYNCPDNLSELDNSLKQECARLCKRRDCVKETFEIRTEELYNTFHCTTTILLHLNVPSTQSTITTSIAKLC